MCLNDVWNITTTGHSTTTAISATAGPIQKSGSTCRRIRRPAPGRDAGGPAAAAGSPAGFVSVVLSVISPSSPDRRCSGAGGVAPEHRTVGSDLAALLGRGLNVLQDRLRITGDGGADRLLDLRLDVRPVGVGRVLD